MSFEKIEIYHSAIRLSRYLKVADNNREKALQYYNANVFVAQNSLPLLHFFEVAFRNAVHTSMSTHFGNSDWLLNLPNSELAKIRGIDTQLKIDVIKAKERIKKHGKIITSDRIVSELSLGFWVELFFDKYQDIIGDAPFISFRNRQENYSISNCYADTRYIRTFRNRLSHHDTLFIQKVMGQDEIFFTRIKEFRVRVFRVLEQIHPDLRYLASKNYDKTDNILTQISVIAQ